MAITPKSKLSRAFLGVPHAVAIDSRRFRVTPLAHARKCTFSVGFYGGWEPADDRKSRPGYWSLVAIIDALAKWARLRSLPEGRAGTEDLQPGAALGLGTGQPAVELHDARAFLVGAHHRFVP